MDKRILFDNIDRIHTTDMGVDRIKRNNWYICVEGCIITVNASSYTIITAHKEKR